MSTTTTPATTPQANVMPFFPAQRPAPVPPSCFSQLYALNQCYDDIVMMKQILAKVITDLFTNDPAMVQSIVDAIAKAGSNVPLIGVTNGSQAQPGQVGEFVTSTVSGTIAAGTGPQNTNVAPLTLQPGDWDVSAMLQFTEESSGGYFVPTFTTGLNGDLVANMSITPPQTLDAFAIGGARAQVNISVPTLLTFELVTWGGQAAPYQFTVSARRAR